VASILFGVFVLLHGLVHLLWFAPAPSDPKWPFAISKSQRLPNASRSTLFLVAVVLVGVTVLGFALAALGLMGVPGLSQVWGTAAVTASASSLIACALFWNPQLIWGPIIDIAILVAVVIGWPRAG
jgi:ABC-type Fe3+ transport system permease subunit